MYLTSQLAPEYDIIIVGAGPAGSMAAKTAAANGANVLCLEKDREVGTPVRCAEGVGKQALEELLGYPAPGRWIAAEITKFRLVAPDGTPVYVNIDETGYVLHRRLFDYDLALQAVNAGATLLTLAEAMDVLKNEQGAVNGVRLKLNGEIREVHSKIVIAADGVESRVARWAGIDSTVKMGDMETCVQYTLAGLDIESDTCDFYFSREFAPGGYAWVFPKGDGTANIGLGIAGNFARNTTPEDYLTKYLERFFPNASLLSCTVGGVPVDKTLRDIVADGFMIVGDAAHQANPISGGGIVSGMIAGMLAGEVATEAIRKGDFSRKSLLPYSRRWHKRVGKSHQRYYRLKEALMRFDDEQFNYIAREYLKLDPGKRSLMNLFKIAFKSNPAFLLDVVRLFSGI
ncbi:MAG: NAD(P)/FAD-dependent oxidoreductase [Calditrichia bacterium]